MADIGDLAHPGGITGVTESCWSSQLGPLSLGELWLPLPVQAFKPRGKRW